MKSVDATGMLLIGLVLGSCDDGEDGQRSSSCRSYCEKLETCDDRTDVAGCERRCSEQIVRSNEYLAARAQCALVSSCNVWTGEVGEMGEDACAEGGSCALNDCTGDMLASMKPSAEQTRYCGTVVTRLRGCEPTLEAPLVEAHCLELVPMLSSGYLSEVLACIEADCGQVQSCLARASDRFNTTISLLPAKAAPASPLK
jgi:hypothetical protein